MSKERLIDRGLRFRTHTLAPAGLVRRAQAAENNALLLTANLDVYQEALAAEIAARERDGLTKLYNRTKAEEILERRVQEIKSGDRRDGFAVLMLDANNFKAVNDSFGHPIGDRVLKVIASALSATVRISSEERPVSLGTNTEKDVAARWGGDEFVVILDAAGVTLEWDDLVLGNLRKDGKSKNGKDSILLRINKAIARMLAEEPELTEEQKEVKEPKLSEAWIVGGARYAKTDVPLYLSGGVSCYVEGRGDTVEKVIDQADKRMYVFKRKYSKKIGKR